MIKRGDTFYYADRDTGEPVKCEAIDMSFGLPNRITARRLDNGKCIYCYDGFGCYELNQFEEAVKDAKIKEDRRIY